MTTEFTIDENDTDLWEDMGSICQMIYPGCRLFYNGASDKLHKYTIDRVIDLESFKKKVEFRQLFYKL